ncbi:nucleophile aminohydrolase [Pelagophyceae sp. CCMP2097]|nr:nucleophile aminohydrolase [Pelagophyceae sp. CCMP2097]|mmetsp:Transcript_8830/g.29135  ORF Transcript_8830/g.29135 Transcript_8830/m.29135 type:complete len:229 (+) Transcript_8830:89-775(+)
MLRSSLRSLQALRAPVRAFSTDMHGTTILCVRKNGRVVMIGDGQVTMGAMVVKGNARKVRKIGDDIMVGFAGSTADAFTLLERLERKLEEHPGQLTRACVDLAKAWRTDKYLRRLEAILLVADKNVTYELTGNGDVLEPNGGVIGIGSGGAYALAAARALCAIPDLEALDVAKRSMAVATELCVYTNSNYIIEELDDLGPNGESPLNQTEAAKVEAAAVEAGVPTPPQ